MQSMRDVIICLFNEAIKAAAAAMLRSLVGGHGDMLMHLVPQNRTLAIRRTHKIKIQVCNGVKYQSIRSKGGVKGDDGRIGGGGALI